MKKLLPLLIISLYLFSCNSNTSKEGTEADTGPLTFKLTELWSTDTILQTPESVLLDAKKGVLYVANMQLATDEDDGFISRLSPDGTILDLEWVRELIAPTGMGINDGKLLVAEQSDLAIIDIESGVLEERVIVEGAGFTNDLSISSEGHIYFTDSPNGRVMIYKEGLVTEWITEGLMRPNGICVEEDRVLIASIGTNDVKSINKETKEMKVLASGIGAGDGISFSGYEGYYLVSDWNGQVFIFNQDTVQSLLDTRESKINAADFEYDVNKKILYVPTFFDNRVVAYKLEVE